MVTDEASAADLLFLEDRINEFNFGATGIHDARDLVILLRDHAGCIYAGLSGHTWGGAAEVKLLWVDEASRHRGVGSGLLRAAEEEARARGCAKMVLSTHSFQAPAFYGRLGYRIAGEVRGYPAGHSHILLEKELV